MHLRREHSMVQYVTLRLDVYQVCQGDSRCFKQEGQHPLTGQRVANFRLLANQ